MIFSNGFPQIIVLHQKIDFPFESPHETCDGAVIRKLNTKEILNLHSIAGDAALLYHHGTFKKSDMKIYLKEDAVIDHPIYALEISKPINIEALVTAFLISKERLCFHLNIDNSCVGHSPDTIHNIYKNRPSFEPKEILLDQNALDKINSLFEMLSKHGENIYAPISMYGELLSISYGSNLWVIGILSILERSLVPRKERFIADKIARKAEYLQSHYKNDTDSVFKNKNKREVWKKLYNWRSKLVHGGYADFDPHNGEFRCLESPEKAKEILDRGVREILRIVADDPEKFEALKEI